MTNSDDNSNGLNKPATPNTSQPQAEESSTNIGPGTADQPASSATSDRKRKANRENAKHSTGPKTERGKNRMRYNALKYGLYSDVIIRNGVLAESQEEFEVLLDGVRRYFHPQGVMEHSQVRVIVDTEWRLRRCAQAEVGEIRKLAATFGLRPELDFEERSDLADGRFFSQELKERARRMAARGKTQLMVLSKVRAEVEQKRYVSVTSQELFDNAFSRNDDNGFAAICYRLSQLVRYQMAPVDTSNPERDKLLELLVPDVVEAPSADACKQKLLELIDLTVAGLEYCVKSLQEAQASEEEATLLAYSLPSQEFVDKLIRYESMLERKKERAIKLLLELQALRKKGRS